MKIQETIAFIGETDKYSERLISLLAKNGYPLVLVSKPGENTGFIASRISQDYPGADVDVVSCETEGCWESDVIVFSGRKQFDDKLIAKMKAVAVQKILLRLSLNDQNPGHTRESVLLEKELPYTKLVWAYPGNREIDLSGDDRESLHQIKTIFNDLGYKVHCLTFPDLV